MNRRDFLKGTAWMGAAAFAAGCQVDKIVGATGAGAPMMGFRVAPMERIRVGMVGLGPRGEWALQRLSVIPGVELVALCDIFPERVEKQQKWLEGKGRPTAKYTFTGPAAHRRLCDCGEVDVVYNCTNWQAHVTVALCAMEHGKHVFTEVPSAFTVDDCWALVETSERTKRFCMQLENCCYGEIEMLALNLCRLGVLGELVHGEGAYIHDLRSNYDWQKRPDKTLGLKPGEEPDYWRLNWNRAHKGNQYPTHGLGPICQYMDINRGDRFDYLVSLESDQFNFEAYAKAVYGADSAKGRMKVAMGDMNTTLVKTAKGRSILVQHDVSSPRPYSRLNTITGTKGILTDYPFRCGWEEKPGAGVHEYFDDKKAQEMRERYRHPMWKSAGPVAETVGGHGGMDFIMDLRWAYCLQNGLPLDTDVYDLATLCSLCELTERSVRGRSKTVECPDFTRGAWRTQPSFGIYDIDVKKMGITLPA